jgi:hypothetical protein
LGVKGKGFSMSLGSRCFEAFIKRGTGTFVGDDLTIDFLFLFYLFIFVDILHDTLKHFKLRIKLECTHVRQQHSNM